MKPRLPIQGSLFVASIEQVHGVCDLQMSIREDSMQAFILNLKGFLKEIHVLKFLK